MKRLQLLIGLIVSLMCVLTSCSKSPEQKAKELVGTEIKKKLYFPESYDLADLQVDSAFTPYDDPEFIGLTKELVKLDKELFVANNDIKRVKEKMSIWSDVESSYSRSELNGLRDELETAQEKYDAVMSEGQKVVGKIKKRINESPKFIGFKAIVSYRAKNNNGDILMDNVFVVFDKNVENVTYMIQGKEYELCQKEFDVMQRGADNDSEEE
ncbi:MAG: hypothetical protein SPF40_08990 [Prevotella sp.]|nr:hypothetical protein [Prevotella sp.]